MISDAPNQKIPKFSLFDLISAPLKTPDLLVKSPGSVFIFTIFIFHPIKK